MKLDEEILKGKQYIDKLRREYIENHTRFQERDELIAENNIETPEEICEFADLEYGFDTELSTENTYVFIKGGR